MGHAHQQPDAGQLIDLVTSRPIDDAVAARQNSLKRDGGTRPQPTGFAAIQPGGIGMYVHPTVGRRKHSVISTRANSPTTYRNNASTYDDDMNIINPPSATRKRRCFRRCLHYNTAHNKLTERLLVMIDTSGKNGFSFNSLAHQHFVKSGAWIRTSSCGRQRHRVVSTKIKAASNRRFEVGHHGARIGRCRSSREQMELGGHSSGILAICCRRRAATLEASRHAGAHVSPDAQRLISPGGNT